MMKKTRDPDSGSGLRVNLGKSADGPAIPAPDVTPRRSDSGLRVNLGGERTPDLSAETLIAPEIAPEIAALEDAPEPTEYYDGGYDGEYDDYDGDYDDDYDDYDDYDEDYDDEEDGPRGKTVGRTVVYMLLVLLASVLLAIGLWFAADDVLALTKPDNMVTITVSEGATLGDVAQNLKNHGLINYKTLFLLYGKFSHAEDKISAGTFELNQQFDYHALVNGMTPTSETRKTVTLTFPEGYTCAQIFSMLAENGVCTLAELEETAATYAFDYEFLEDRPYGDRYRLEGFLFPDTYDFYVDDTPQRVINKMLYNFSNRVSDEMLAAIADRNLDIRARMEEEGTFTEEEIENAMLDLYKVLTIASLIEKEAGSDTERTLISSVIYNRLTTHVHELLQIDASVEYALGEHKAKLTDEDLAVDSPYNTYLYKGLPPGPIANPGIASITAALYPRDTNYFFYALDGSTHRFFETYMEQQDFLRGVLPDTAEALAPSPTPSETPEPSEEPETPYEQVPIEDTGG